MDCLANVIVQNPDQAMFRQAENSLATARAYQIDSQEMRDLAGEDLQQIKRRQKTIESQRLELTAPLNAVVKKINDMFRQPKDWLDEAERLLKGAILIYDQAQAAKAAEEQRLREEAARIERERIAAEAEKAREAGRAEEANAMAQVAEMVIAPPVAVPVQKTAGISTRSNWTAEVVDLMELVKAVAAGTQPLSLLQADTTKLTQMAKALKGELNIPGVRAVENKIISARAA